MAESVAEIWDSFLLAFERWRARVIFVLLALVFGLSYLGGGQTLAAQVVAFGLPALATLNALAARRNLAERRNGGAGAAIAFLVALGVLSATERLAAHTFFEPSPWGVVSLSTDHREAEVVVPSRDFEVETHGQVPEGSASAEGKYALQLTRAGTTLTVGGELSRTAQQMTRRRRMPAAIAGHVYDTERQLVELPGSGPVQLKLDTLEGSIGKSIEVRMLSAPMGGHWAIVLLCVMLGAAVVIDSLSRPRKFPGFAGWLCAAAVFSWRTWSLYTFRDPMAVIVSALFIAIAAAFAGFIVTWILSRFTAGLVKSPAD